MSLLSLALALTLSVQSGQGPPSAAEAARMDAPFERAPRWGASYTSPSSGWSYRDEFHQIAGMVWIYADLEWSGIEGERARIIYVARRLERRRDVADTVRWTDSDACPALTDRLRAFEAVPTPGLTIFGLDEAPDGSLRGRTLHGLHWTLWTHYLASQTDGEPADVSMSSNAGAIAEWGNETRATLEPCWRETPPVPHIL